VISEPTEELGEKARELCQAWPAPGRRSLSLPDQIRDTQIDVPKKRSANGQVKAAPSTAAIGLVPGPPLQMCRKPLKSSPSRLVLRPFDIPSAYGADCGSRSPGGG